MKKNRISMMICLAFCAVLLAGCGQPKNFKLKDPTLEVVSQKVAEAILTDAGTDEDAVQSLRDNYDSYTQQLVQYTCYVIPEDLPETWVDLRFYRRDNPRRESHLPVCIQAIWKNGRFSGKLQV